MTGQVDDETFIRLMAQYIGHRKSASKLRREIENPPTARAAEVETERRRKRRERAAFERSQEWRELAALVKREQPFCAQCGSTENLHADHIKPKSRFPELRLVRENIQMLCKRCNFRKGVQVR